MTPRAANDIERDGRSAADIVYARLREAILDGELRPNSRVTEAEIGRQYAVSRTPVREAFQRLKADGLLRESARSLLVSEFTIEELTNICSVRDELEALAARLAATRRSDFDLLALDEQNERFAAAIDGDLATVVVLNHSFHEIIWAASHNSYLVAQLQATRRLVERLDNTTLDTPKRQAEALEEHRAIAETLRARDEAQARDVTFLHFQKASAMRLQAKRLRSLESS
jgi:DNA-binding GntR family transcriptional regulator